MAERQPGNRLIDLTGQSFSQLTIESRHYGKGHNAQWNCRCTCGSVLPVRGSDLRSGKRTHCKLCSFKLREKENKVPDHPLYSLYYGMMTRCYNKSMAAYPRYGGRGIEVCERWHSFTQFCLDMGDRPPEASLERINNELGYSPDNCKWATMKEQGNNRTGNKLLTVEGVTKTQAQWATEKEILPATIYQRLRRGLTAKEAIENPVNKRLKRSWSAKDAVFTPSGEKRK